VCPQASFAVLAALKCQHSYSFGREVKRTIFRFGLWPDSALDCICTQSPQLVLAAGQDSEVKWQRSANIGAVCMHAAVPLGIGSDEHHAQEHVLYAIGIGS
jgi:hypothetical protein